MRKFYILPIAFLLLTGFGKPQHSTVEVTNETTKDGMSFSFKIAAKDKHKVTFDAPWKLEIKDAEGLKFAKSEFDKSEMDEKLPGYKISTQGAPTATSGKLGYKLISFICTADKTQCYREVHKGTFDWKTGL